MQTYLNKRKAQDRAASPAQEQAPSRSEMLHLSGAGAPQPMSPQLREKFEPGFGADFSNIRISRGHIPDEMGVQAVAQGTDILLDESAGMDVLGHELAHVVQQAQGRVDGGYPVVENAALEQEADIMGQRVASGLTAQAGPQNGFGGEMMSIAPMSSASAPAQCKSREEKAREKMQISQPTLLQPGTAGYKNSALVGKELERARKNTSTAHGVATTQMLNSLQDPAYMQRVMAHTGSSEEQIRSDMGKMVGGDYASQVLQLDPHSQNLSERDDAMFRGNYMGHLNWGKFLQGEMSGSMGPTIAAVKSSPLTEVEDQGKIVSHLDPAMVDAQIASLASAAKNSTPTMLAVDEFLKGMRQGGSDMEDQHLEELISNEIFLRGVTPHFTDASVRHSGDEAKKLKTMGGILQRKINKAQMNLVPGRMAQVAPVPAPAPQPAPTPFETDISDLVNEDDSPQEMQDRVEEGMFNYYNIPQALFDEMTDERGHMLDVATIVARADAASPSYLGMRGMFNEDRAAMEASDPSYLGMRGMFNEDRAANAVRTPNYSGVKALFTEPKPSPPAAETSYAEMRTLFNPSLDPGALEARREARAAYQESSEASFSGNMRSLFCENRPKSVAEELGLPEAPGEKYVTGLTELEDLYEAEQEEAAAARAYTGESEQMYSGNKATGELERMMNMSDEEENELMKDVRILDPANDPPLFPEPAPAPAAQKKKNHWWQFWR